VKSDYLENVKQQLEHYKILGEKTFVQLADEKLFWQYNETSNSVATLVKHLWSNMLSRWTGFLTTEGETEWKNRDAEFYNDIKSRQELLHKWNEGWSCLMNSINALTEADLQRTVYIRNQAHTVTEAINRQLAHYSYHIGQIVYIGKMVCDHEWASLTYPRGDSKLINEEKFLKSEYEVHFTEAYLRENRF
jgi:hypothetical protein